MFQLKINQKGLAAIELTLILPLMLLLLFATVEFSRLLYQYNALTQVVRDTARFIIGNARDGSTESILITEETISNAKAILAYGQFSSAAQILPNLAAAAENVDITVDGEFITVTVSYPWQPIFASSLPSFVSDKSFDLSFPLVTRYTMRAL